MGVPVTKYRREPNPDGGDASPLLRSMTTIPLQYHREPIPDGGIAAPPSASCIRINIRRSHMAPIPA